MIRSAQAFASAARDEAAPGLVEDHLRAGREVRFTLVTTSMWPALIRGDEISVRRADPARVRPGEIVFTRSGDAWLAHRLIAAGPGGLITKGDNSPRPDDPWPAAEMRGVVVAVRRAGREARLDSAPARRAAAFLAGLSRVQAALGRDRPGPVRRFASRGVGLALRLCAAAMRRASGL